MNAKRETKFLSARKLAFVWKFIIDGKSIFGHFWYLTELHLVLRARIVSLLPHTSQGVNHSKVMANWKLKQNYSWIIELISWINHFLQWNDISGSLSKKNFILARCVAHFFHRKELKNQIFNLIFFCIVFFSFSFSLSLSYIKHNNSMWFYLYKK